MGYIRFNTNDLVLFVQTLNIKLKGFGLRMFELKMLSYKMIEDLKIKQRVQDELNEKFFVKIEN